MLSGVSAVSKPVAVGCSMIMKGSHRAVAQSIVPPSRGSVAVGSKPVAVDSMCIHAGAVLPKKLDVGLGVVLNAVLFLTGSSSRCR